MPKSAIRKGLLAAVVWLVMASAIGAVLAAAVGLMVWDRV